MSTPDKKKEDKPTVEVKDNPKSLGGDPGNFFENHPVANPPKQTTKAEDKKEVKK